MPKWDFEDRDVLEWASVASEDKLRFVRSVAEWPQEQCDALGKFVQSLYGRRVEDRGSIQKLMQALREVPKFRSDRDAKSRSERERLDQSNENRKALAAVIKAHPKGQLIAGEMKKHKR